MHLITSPNTCSKKWQNGGINGQLNNNVWRLNTPLPIIGRITRKEIKVIKGLNNAIIQLNLRDIFYRAFYPITAKYTFLTAHGIFFRILLYAKP